MIIEIIVEMMIIAVNQIIAIADLLAEAAVAKETVVVALEATVVIVARDMLVNQIHSGNSMISFPSLLLRILCFLEQRNVFMAGKKARKRSENVYSN